MLLKDFITKDFPVLKSFDTGEYALSMMDELKVKQLPCVDNDGIYKSLLSEKELLVLPDLSAPIGEPSLFAPGITEQGHLHEVIARMSRYKLCLLPVVNDEGKYVGVFTRDRLIDALAEFCSVEAPGSIIILEMFPQDYVLSDIARIVEANNAHVLNLLNSVDQDTGRLHITIKIDLDDATPVIRSFERFNYTVLYHYMEKGMVDEVLQQRMNELLYYMNL
ncbi:CBS domain-containing protein [Parabacteroides sp. PF5-5]|uniref:CBS domain-containing protein n=1 Tax=unclassified Parabacteroides TaxID=2649774 RepID=UPI0024744003|nr:MULTISPECIES: CBS domain-containing protein [unclassified Parabacteroides]MDH6305802.1 CBS domain-containing protein [Parabacteroides sp. PH5-39]MDH6317761.1 CBS domain-containing protein [Parabacteroides sp. PF5-13]MDH6320592.1 CBS domain-containing protein [Parabacteroides sp. PH5-13]MDH6324245.1 CBS domain-containing protein [Parabacteroides sp. PH5-8]MDH6328946.1 CBS domain-containing protein [Parabacteroides sp. PH5-41]